MKKLSVIAMTFLLVACATGYKDGTGVVSGFTGGYWDSKGPGETIIVGFAGNSHISGDLVGIYLLYRCAEITKERGANYFSLYQSLPAAIADRKSDKKIVSNLSGKPAASVYILIEDKLIDGAISADDVIQRYKSIIGKKDTK
jgi:hypothetical protein